jgi:hypothetical protein
VIKTAYLCLFESFFLSALLKLGASLSQWAGYLGNFCRTTLSFSSQNKVLGFFMRFFGVQVKYGFNLSLSVFIQGFRANIGAYYDRIFKRRRCTGVTKDVKQKISSKKS